MRRHAVWALAEIGAPETLLAVGALKPSEEDPFAVWVLDEGLATRSDRGEEHSATVPSPVSMR